MVHFKHLNNHSSWPNWYLENVFSFLHRYTFPRAVPISPLPPPLQNDRIWQPLAHYLLAQKTCICEFDRFGLDSFQWGSALPNPCLYWTQFILSHHPAQIPIALVLSKCCWKLKKNDVKRHFLFCLLLDHYEHYTSAKATMQILRLLSKPGRFSYNRTQCFSYSSLLYPLLANRFTILLSEAHNSIVVQLDKQGL